MVAHALVPLRTASYSAARERARWGGGPPTHHSTSRLPDSPSPARRPASQPCTRLLTYVGSHVYLYVRVHVHRRPSWIWTPSSRSPAATGIRRTSSVAWRPQREPASDSRPERTCCSPTPGAWARLFGCAPSPPQNHRSAHISSITKGSVRSRTSLLKPPRLWHETRGSPQESEHCCRRSSTTWSHLASRGRLQSRPVILRYHRTSCS